MLTLCKNEILTASVRDKLRTKPLTNECQPIVMYSKWMDISMSIRFILAHAGLYVACFFQSREDLCIFQALLYLPVV